MCFIGNEVGIAKPATRPGGLAPESVARGAWCAGRYRRRVADRKYKLARGPWLWEYCSVPAGGPPALERRETMKTCFDFISDPGHGWIKVPIVLLCQLGIAGKVSPYSLWRKGYAYLEEDCDAELLFRAFAERGLKIKFRERNRAEGYSRVRGYHHYQAHHYI